MCGAVRVARLEPKSQEIGADRPARRVAGYLGTAISCAIYRQGAQMLAASDQPCSCPPPLCHIISARLEPTLQDNKLMPDAAPMTHWLLLLGGVV